MAVEMRGQEVIYEVNLQVNPLVAEAFAAWLEEHIEEMLQLDGFVSANRYRAEAEPSAQQSFVVHYRLLSRQKLESYFNGPAAKMREQGLQKFPGEFTASRRILSDY